MIHPEFEVHMLNDDGKKKAAALAIAFSNLLTNILDIVNVPSRELSIVRTKLEEASFFAKKAMAIQPMNQQ